MADYVKIGNYQVDQELYDFVNKDVLPDTGLTYKQLWADFE
ncbi:hypothetical protein V7087_06445 [Neobacillus niacini]